MSKEFPENSTFLGEIAKYGFSREWVKLFQEIRSEDLDWIPADGLPSNFQELSPDERELVFIDNALSRKAAETLEVAATRRMGWMRQKELIGKIDRQRAIELLGEDRLDRIEKAK